MARKQYQGSAEHNNVLFVEGTDDMHVIKGLLGVRGLTENDLRVTVPGTESSETAGYESLRKEASVVLRNGKFKRLGIVVDADENMPGRWESLRAMLIESGYSEMPSSPMADGTVISHDTPELLENAEAPFFTRVGVWIMPDNQLTGAIEDFVRHLVPPEKSLLWDHAEVCVANLPIKPEPINENWKAKARIHSYLAWQKNPRTPMGLAITQRYLDGNSPTADPFVDWVRRLYELP